MITEAHLHPMAVHFPIAVILLGFIVDFVSLFWKKESCLSKMGYWLEIVGMLGAIVAFGTGYFLTNPMEGEAGDLRERHELFATLTLVSIIIATLFRVLATYMNKEETRIKYISLILLFFSVVLVIITGMLGGQLVYDYMIGI